MPSAETLQEMKEAMDAADATLAWMAVANPQPADAYSAFQNRIGRTAAGILNLYDGLWNAEAVEIYSEGMSLLDTWEPPGATSDLGSNRGYN